MNVGSMDKIKAAGFVIIRREDHPSVRIKQYTGNGCWKTLENYLTKTSRDRAFKELLTESKIIED